MTEQTKPILLFNDECAVCRRIARWVSKSARAASGQSGVIVRPIGDDPDALRLLNPDLDIWDAYATIHLLMPDGSMKLGGEAVAELLRALPNTRWFAWAFALKVFGLRPFQRVLNLGYAILADTRPLFGCESCGTPAFWMRPFHWVAEAVKSLVGTGHQQKRVPHFSPRSREDRKPARVAVDPVDSEAVSAWRNEGDPN